MACHFRSLRFSPIVRSGRLGFEVDAVISIGVACPGLVLDNRVFPVVGDSEACRPLSVRGEGFRVFTRVCWLSCSLGLDLGGGRGRHMEHPVEAVVELVDAPVHEGQSVYRHL